MVMMLVVVVVVAAVTLNPKTLNPKPHLVEDVVSHWMMVLSLVRHFWVVVGFHVWCYLEAQELPQLQPSLKTDLLSPLGL